MRALADARRRRHRAQLVEKLTEEFDVDEQTARNDVEAFLATCRENDLLASPRSTDQTPLNSTAAPEAITIVYDPI